MKDPYRILGVNKTASEAEIKSAYRKLAKQYHPDVNKGDKNSEKHFSEATTAYDFLSDKAKRGQYDRGEIDADGNPRFQGFHQTGGRARGRASQGGNPFAGMGSGFHQHGFGAQMGGDDIFSHIFGETMGQRRGFNPKAGQQQNHSRQQASQTQQPPQKREISLNVPLDIAFSGGQVIAEIAAKRQIKVKIPKDIYEGQQIRVRDGKDEIYFRLHLQPKAPYYFEGERLFRRLPITLYEAILGSSIEVETPLGQVNIKLQAGTTGDKALRLKAHGLLQKGKSERDDLFVMPHIILPENDTYELKTLMEFWQKNKAYNPR